MSAPPGSTARPDAGAPGGPPVAERRPHVVRVGDDARVDDWYWLRDRDDPAVIAYLEAENDFTRAALASTAERRDRIYAEIVERIQETDVSAPVRWGAWQHYTRTIAGLQYAVHCRRPAGDPTLPDPSAAPGAPAGEQVLLDENALAEGHRFFELGDFEPSPGQALLAYAVDLTGAERYTLRFRDLGTGLDLPDVVPDTSYGVAWADDGRTVFFTRPNEAMRPWQVWRHTLGGGDDVLVLQEDDERFNLSVDRARTGRFVVITSRSRLTTEVSLLDTATPAGPPRVVARREEGVQYFVEPHHSPLHGDRLFVVTNADDAPNFRLMVAPVGGSGRARWQEVVPHRSDVRLVDVDAFADHLVLSERADATERIRVRRLADGAEHVVEVPEAVSSTWVGPNPEFDTTTLRYQYTSLVTPLSSYDYDLESRAATLVKRQQVSGYDAGRFETRREWAVAPDGERVPISLVHRRDVPRDGRAPLLLYGYGSYELPMDPTFSIARLSLLERGVVFALAHVRGGGELGRRWYDDGKLDHKRNTFTDFVACAEHLVEQRATSPDRLAARGASAGGLLIGVVANERPDLFCALVAEVPFVDCLTTMLDPSLPLTVNEWEEWGNPAGDPAIYEYIKGYSPYDNVGSHDYPALLVTAGLNDPRVQYWEPAKWVAKLRATADGDRPLLLKTEMGAGHMGPSGRYDAWRDEALILAFVLDQLGIEEHHATG